MRRTLEEQKGNCLGAGWKAGRGAPFFSCDPATGEEVWRGRAANEEQVDEAVGAARRAGEEWRELGFDRRLDLAVAFGTVLERKREDLAHLISREVGKPLWESRTEVAAMIRKIPLSAAAYRDRCPEAGQAVGEATLRTRFRPHGVLAVFGPFNFPGHLANGHIVPALLAGNTVLFKPSERAPAVACRMIEAWQEAGLPPGVLNLVQGGAATGETLASHPGIDGLLFTGSHSTGMLLHRLFAAAPEKILALEMGGNNPLVVWEAEEVAAAALLVVQSAFLTAGQRCTCARRLILSTGRDGDDLLEALTGAIHRIRVGAFTEVPEPFMGPVISSAVADGILEAQRDWLQKGAVRLVEARRLRAGSGLISPGLVDVTRLEERADEELFGPVLQVVRVPDFSAALAEANRTRFGLAAGLVSRRADLWEAFRKESRAGVVNWNHPLTGASGRAPFGGLGQSGNHRPSGYLAADYCASPIASMETPRLVRPVEPPIGLRQP